MRRLIRFMLILILLSSVAEALHNLNYPIDQIVINSKDWKDVYSGMLFGKLIGKDVTFVNGNDHAVLVANSLDRTKSNVLLLHSKESYYVSYGSYLSAKGFNVNSPDTDNLNLYLANSLDVENFIIIEGAYGYNAISVAPYAMLTQAYVLFAQENIEDITDLLDKKAKDVMIYGYVNPDLMESLERYSPKIIDRGDRYSDNIAIFEEFSEIKSPKQTVITSGEFIEEGFFTDINPVIFIGKSRIPDEIEKHIIEKRDIEIFVLIGNQYVSMVQRFKDRMKDQHGYDMSIIIKLGMTPRGATTETHSIADLETFPIPSYELDFSLASIRFNSFYNQLEVTFRNDGEIATFFRSTINIGDMIIEDSQVYDVPARRTRTIPYPIDPIEITGNVVTIYGDSANTLDNQMENSLDILQRVNVNDDSRANATGLIYNPVGDFFTVTVKNTGDVSAYVEAELKDVIVNGEPSTLNSRVIEIPKGKSRDLKIRAKLDDVDLEENEAILVKIYFGVRQDSLFKTSEKTFGFRMKYISNSTIVIGLVMVTIIMLLILLRKKEYTCEDCQSKQKMRMPRECKVCGGKVR